MHRAKQYLKRNEVELIRSGEHFVSRLEALISGATKEIHIQCYILEPDETGLRIMAALKEASRRNIKVFVLVDAYGSQNFSVQYRRELKAAGIYIKRFGRFYARGSFHIGRRLHRKVFVADGEVAMVGGINLSNKYTDQTGSPAWLDFAVEIKGDAALRLLLICRKQWLKIPFKSFTRNLREGIKSNFPQIGTAVKVSENDYINRKNEIALTYRKKISSCTHSLMIVGGYFLPGGKMRRILVQAKNRGVDITILVSDKSDVMLVDRSRRYLYSWLLRHNMKVYEYLPSNVHGKVLITDNNFVSIGSYDLNNLSTYSNVELNLDIADEKIAGEFQNIIHEIIKKDCRLLTQADLKKRFGIFSQLLNWSSYQLVKTFFVLSVLTANKAE